MSAIPGLLGLLLFIYIRPHEFVEGLSDLNFLHVFLALALLGVGHDLSERRTKLMATPQLPFVLALTAWCFLGLAVVRPSALGKQASSILVCAALFLVIGHGVQRASSYLKLALTIFTFGLFVAFVGAHQGVSPYQCVVRNPTELNGRAWADGRPCSNIDDEGEPRDGWTDCYIEGGNPNLVYGCEHAGLLGTTSIGMGRVRYLGVLQDPNELALATAMAVPFAFVLLELRRTFLRTLLLGFTLLVVGAEIVFTSSRGGQASYLTVLGAYFIRRFGWVRGAVAGAALAIPLILLGGRSGEDADQSTYERLLAGCAAIKMLISYPITGVGYSQFTQHHPLTAHNAYLLAAAELGAVGMTLFAFILYLSLKVPLLILRADLPPDEESAKLRTVAMGLTASLVGAIVGIFFLSWTYHFVLWIHVGLSAALFTVAKRKNPAFQCSLSWKEAVAIPTGYLGFLIFWAFYIKRHGAWE